MHNEAQHEKLRTELSDARQQLSTRESDLARAMADVAQLQADRAFLVALSLSFSGSLYEVSCTLQMETSSSLQKKLEHQADLAKELAAKLASEEIARAQAETASASVAHSLEEKLQESNQLRNKYDPLPSSAKSCHGLIAAVWKSAPRGSSYSKSRPGLFRTTLKDYSARRANT
jgi:multidrug resistance efflux pump